LRLDLGNRERCEEFIQLRDGIGAEHAKRFPSSETARHLGSIFRIARKADGIVDCGIASGNAKEPCATVEAWRLDDASRSLGEFSQYSFRTESSRRRSWLSNGKTRQRQTVIALAARFGKSLIALHRKTGRLSREFDALSQDELQDAAAHQAPCLDCRPRGLQLNAAVSIDICRRHRSTPRTRRFDERVLRYQSMQPDIALLDLHPHGYPIIYVIAIGGPAEYPPLLRSESTVSGCLVLVRRLPSVASESVCRRSTGGNRARGPESAPGRALATESRRIPGFCCGQCRGPRSCFSNQGGLAAFEMRRDIDTQRGP